jgi:CHASE2 domain-containing sensor protein
MSSKVFISLGAGSLSEGFDLINSRLEVDGKLLAQYQGSLPGNSELQDLYYQWQFHYAAYYDNYPYAHSLRSNAAKIELDSTGVTGFSVTSFAETQIQLEAQMLDWLDSSSFNTLVEPLLWSIGDRHAEVIIIIESADERIYRLPWHCWRALLECQQAEITFSLNAYQRQISTSYRTKPRILAVFGDRTGIDTNADAEFIQQLQADVVTIVEPSLSQLRQQLADPQGWDLLFFAGHGCEDRIGAIRLNASESVTLNDLSHAIKAAIGRGLKLAIFNCCSGLGVAASLAACDLPAAIVMREAIPNRVAQDFLQTFLQSFESGSSLLVAVATARHRLQSIESDFPCATWLPVVFWNPTVELPTWKSFYNRSPAPMSPWKLGAIVLATTAAIWGVRSQGYLESVELATYDLEMNSRPIAEPPDDRILIVGVDRDKPLSDRALVKTLQKLQKYHPKAIGLDIYRDIEFGEGHRDLTDLLRTQDAIVSSCLMSGNSKTSPGVPAPDRVQPDRVGFTNFSLDPDGAIRRQVLGMAAVDRGCTTDHSLSLRLVLKYLDVTADEAEDGNINIGNRKLEVLGSSVGGYRSIAARDNLRGFQVMLNYRNTAQVAPMMSLEELLSDSQHLEPRIAGKVVLLGYIGHRNADTWHSLGKKHQLPGVTIHAQMTSNLLSYMLDDRPLITTWGDLAEFGWILLWGTVGGVMWYRVRGYRFWIAQAGVIVVVVATCGIYLNTRSVWIPLIPAEMSAILTFLVAMGVDRFKLVDRR